MLEKIKFSIFHWGNFLVVESKLWGNEEFEICLIWNVRNFFVKEYNDVTQHSEVTETENVWNKEFAIVCNLFVDNKLWSHFGEEKTKWILFRQDNNRIKQYHAVEYLGCLSWR